MMMMFSTNRPRLRIMLLASAALLAIGAGVSLL
jgi:hypothetical protein